MLQKHSAYCHGERRKLEQFSLPIRCLGWSTVSHCWSKAECLFFNLSAPVYSEEAKVREQRGYFICHPSPATKPLANTLVFNLSSPVRHRHCCPSAPSSTRRLRAGSGAVGRCAGQETISTRPGSTFLEFAPFPWTLDFNSVNRKGREGSGHTSEWQLLVL